MSQMTPREIVQELDNHIISQNEAKRNQHGAKMVSNIRVCF